MRVNSDIVAYLRDYHNTEFTAIKGRDLCTLFNLHSKQIRNIVGELRQSGEPICSSNCGYWYSTNVEDLDRTIGRLSAQVKNMNLSVDGLYRAREAIKNEN